MIAQVFGYLMALLQVSNIRGNLWQRSAPSGCASHAWPHNLGECSGIELVHSLTAGNMSL